MVKLILWNKFGIYRQLGNTNAMKGCSSKERLEDQENRLSCECIRHDSSKNKINIPSTLVFPQKLLQNASRLEILFYREQK